MSDPRGWRTHTLTRLAWGGILAPLRAAREGGDMIGHGHVRPNPDGSRARCGGPGLCSVCSAEAAREWVAMRNERDAALQRAKALHTAILDMEQVLQPGIFPPDAIAAARKIAQLALAQEKGAP